MTTACPVGRSSAHSIATSGSTQGGIIAHSLALSQNVSERGAYALILDSWHRPLRQRMVLLSHACDTARRFYDFVVGPSGRSILAAHGFSHPGEAYTKDQ